MWGKIKFSGDELRFIKFEKPKRTVNTEVSRRMTQHELRMHRQARWVYFMTQASKSAGKYVIRICFEGFEEEWGRIEDEALVAGLQMAKARADKGAFKPLTFGNRSKVQWKTVKEQK